MAAWSWAGSEDAVSFLGLQIFIKAYFWLHSEWYTLILWKQEQSPRTVPTAQSPRTGTQCSKQAESFLFVSELGNVPCIWREQPLPHKWMRQFFSLRTPQVYWSVTGLWVLAQVYMLAAADVIVPATPSIPQWAKILRCIGRWRKSPRIITKMTTAELLFEETSQTK